MVSILSYSYSMFNHSLWWHIYTYIHPHLHTSTPTHIHTHICIHIPTHIHIYIYTHIHTHANTFTYIGWSKKKTSRNLRVHNYNFIILQLTIISLWNLSKTYDAFNISLNFQVIYLFCNRIIKIVFRNCNCRNWLSFIIVRGLSGLTLHSLPLLKLTKLHVSCSRVTIFSIFRC